MATDVQNSPPGTASILFTLGAMPKLYQALEFLSSVDPTLDKQAEGVYGKMVHSREGKEKFYERQSNLAGKS